MSDGYSEVSDLKSAADSLSPRDKTLPNNRSRPLKVVGRHRKERDNYQHWVHDDDHYRIVELEGNGTEYHLLYTPTSEVKPILYKEADWEETTDGYEYPRSGERVESIEVIKDGE